MQVRIRSDSVEIEGYVNAIERDSKPLWSRTGRFIERIRKGAFKRALERNKDVQLLLNHDWNKNLGSTQRGNLELTEDSIGLKARAVISDPDVVKDARQGNLVGWSFGFEDMPNGFIERIIDGIKHRSVKDLNLYEVSILNRAKTPAYDGTLIMVRDDGEETEKMIYRSEPYIDEVETEDETMEERFNPNHNPSNVQFAPSGGSGSGASSSGEKWDYRGTKQQVDKIENAVKDAKTGRQAEAAYKALKGQEDVITKEIKRIEDGLEPEGDARALYSQLRRVRKLKKDLLGKGIMGQRTQELIDDIELDDAFLEAKINTDVRENPTETQPKQQEIVDKNIDYSKYEQIIAELKED